jgi:hypothetical protein
LGVGIGAPTSNYKVVAAKLMRGKPVMPTLDSLRRCFWFLLLIFALPLSTKAQQGSIVRMWPANGATNVNPDTHLVISFLSPPTLGSKGTIRIYDATDNKLVDMLDLSIPAGSDFRRWRPTGSPPDTQTYQVNTIGGVEGFHFYPIIIATIYPHSHVLQYNRKYIVKNAKPSDDNKFQTQLAR